MTAAATSTLATMTPADQQRVLLAVTDRGPGIYHSPLVGGSADNVARYIAEGRDLTGALEGDHDWRAIAAAISETITAHPHLIERTPAQAKADADTRLVRLDQLADQASAAFNAGDIAGALTLIDQLLALDPDHRLVGGAAGRAMGRRVADLRPIVSEQLASAAH